MTGLADVAMTKLAALAMMDRGFGAGGRYIYELTAQAEADRPRAKPITPPVFALRRDIFTLPHFTSAKPLGKRAKRRARGRVKAARRGQVQA